MSQVQAIDVKVGDQLLIEGEEYSVLANVYHKPGKGHATNVMLLLGKATGLETEMTFLSDTLLELIP